MNVLHLTLFAAAHPAVMSALASAGAGMATLAALLIARASDRGVTVLVGGFAAASLLASTLLHLLPKAVALSPDAGAFALAGFALMYLIQSLTRAPDRARTPLLAALAPMLAIGAHSSLDGALHATVFAVDVPTGLAAAPGLVLHEIAETTLLFVLLLGVGVGRWAAAGLAFLGAVATTPAGVLISAGPIGSLTPDQLGCALAVVAGSLLFLSVSHLADAGAPARRWPRFAAFALGVTLTLALLTQFWSAGAAPHDHTHQERRQD